MTPRIARPLAAVAFIAAVALMSLGSACGGGDDQGTGTLVPFVVTSTPTPTDQPASTPTPPPYDGPIARMKIPSLGIDNAIEQIGILANNELDTPHDAINKIGWYYIYAKPGFGSNAVFSAHVNYNFKQGPFARLAEAQPGEEILVQMENGAEYKYKIFSKQRYDVDSIPMGDLIWPKNRPDGKEWVTLITCGGRFVATQANGLGEYKDRDVVIAERVQ